MYHLNKIAVESETSIDDPDINGFLLFYVAGGLDDCLAERGDVPLIQRRDVLVDGFGERAATGGSGERDGLVGIADLRDQDLNAVGVSDDA